MTDNMILDAIKDFLAENVAKKIKLQKPVEDSKAYEIINPSVHVGWIPPKLPENMRIEDQVQDVPCIIVGLDDGQDDGNDAGLGIRLSFVTFSNGTVKEGKLFPNFDGYKDLLNFMTLSRMELSKISIFKDVASLQRSFQWGMYQDQLYPYWSGWLTFKVSCVVLEQVPTIEEQYE